MMSEPSSRPPPSGAEALSHILPLNAKLDPGTFPSASHHSQVEHFPRCDLGWRGSRVLLVASAAKPHLQPGLFL